MNSSILLRVAGPMILLSLLLLTLGILAAYNVHEQQKANSQLITREVTGMFAVQNVYIDIREIRREMELYLRKHDNQHLRNVESQLIDADKSLEEAKASARTPREAELIEKVDVGFHGLEKRFRDLVVPDNEADIDDQLLELVDDFLTPHILQPIQECVEYNRDIVARTTANAVSVSEHLRLGFLLLGISGSIAGLLFGLGIARTLSRYIVQLEVTVKSAAGKLHEVGRPVHISRLGDLTDLEFSVRRLESDIGEVVQTLQAREMEILRNEQLAIVGQLAAGMAHEIRNPLMPIKVLVQDALERGPEGAIKGQNLAIVNEEIGRLERSIQSLLDFARPPALETAYLEITSILKRSAALVASQAAQQRVYIDLKLPDTPVMSRVDVGQIHQVILNLLLNALDAVSSNGVIELELIPEIPDPMQVTPVSPGDFTEHDAMRLKQPPTVNKWYAIRLSDNGPGVPEELIDRAFDPFFTTKETGTGLGLPICKRIIVAHGGMIELTNLEPHGAQFMIRLPYCD